MAPDEKVVVTLDDFEQRLLVSGLADFRNDLIRDEKPTEDRLTETLEELKRIEAGSGVDPDLLEIIQTITQIVDNLYIK